MFKDLFPHRAIPIRWFSFSDADGRSLADEFFEGLSVERYAALTARMLAWAQHGRWDSPVKYVEQLITRSERAVYKLKGLQERLIFTRCVNCAVAVGGLAKKTDSSVCEKDSLDEMLPLVDAAASEWNGDNE